MNADKNKLLLASVSLISLGMTKLLREWKYSRGQCWRKEEERRSVLSVQSKQRTLKHAMLDLSLFEGAKGLHNNDKSSHIMKKLETLSETQTEDR